MSGHVWSWIAGYGWTLMPRAPFRIERVEGRPRAVRVQHFSADGTREAIVTIAETGEAEWELGAGTESLDQVLDLIHGAAYEHWSTGAAYDHWRVETYVLTVRWPEGFALESTTSAPPPFDLVASNQARIWIQGPLSANELPPLERMAASGQTVAQVINTPAGPMVELSYQHEEAPWRQFHCRVDRIDPPPTGPLALFQRFRPRYVAVVSGQAPETDAGRARRAVVEMAASLTPCPPER